MGILMTFLQVGRPKETMKFPHLKGREKLLRPLGFTPQQAEWITLVCLHSGLFTRDQVEAFFGYAKSSANRFIQALLRTRISHKPIASETITDGRRICRIFGKQIYRELEIPHIRHRRETSLEVTRRRLLSLDFVLDHPELAWLPTEQDKVACFQQLGVEPGMLPCRIYAGHARGRVRYFPLKMPVAMGPEAALFVYIDPGMGTRSELHSWREAHRPLWQMLREYGWRIEVVAVAWEQELLDRAERVMQSWVGRDLTEAGRELLILRWAVSNADRETVERYGGLNAALRKINQLKQATGRGKWSTLRSTTYPSPSGGRSLHSDPCGKAVMRPGGRARDHCRYPALSAKGAGGRTARMSEFCNRQGAQSPQEGRKEVECPLQERDRAFSWEDKGRNGQTL